MPENADYQIPEILRVELEFIYQVTVAIQANKEIRDVRERCAVEQLKYDMRDIIVHTGTFHVCVRETKHLY